MSQPMILQRCVALKIVVANRLVQHHLKGLFTRKEGNPGVRVTLALPQFSLFTRRVYEADRVILALPECWGGGGYPTCCCSLRNPEIANKNYNLRTYFDMNFDNSKRKVLKLEFRSFFVVVENSRAVKLLVKNDWLNFSIH